MKGWVARLLQVLIAHILTSYATVLVLPVCGYRSVVWWDGPFAPYSVALQLVGDVLRLLVSMFGLGRLRWLWTEPAVPLGIYGGFFVAFFCLVLFITRLVRRRHSLRKSKL